MVRKEKGGDASGANGFLEEGKALVPGKDFFCCLSIPGKGAAANNEGDGIAFAEGSAVGFGFIAIFIIKGMIEV